jgi:hypothetical protein
MSEFVADLAVYPDVEGFVTSEPIVPDGRRGACGRHA